MSPSAIEFFALCATPFVAWAGAVIGAAIAIRIRNAGV